MVHVARLLVAVCGVATSMATTSAAPRVKCSDTAYMLVSDLELPVSRCENCFPGAKYPVALTAQASKTVGYADPDTVWKKCSIDGSPNKVMLLSPDNNKFMTRCDKCYPSATKTDSVFVFGDEANAAAQWTMETIQKKSDGDIVAFKADNGKYLSRCLGCVAGASAVNALFVSEPTSAASYARFRLVALASGIIEFRD